MKMQDGYNRTLTLTLSTKQKEAITQVTKGLRSGNLRLVEAVKLLDEHGISLVSIRDNLLYLVLNDDAYIGEPKVSHFDVIMEGKPLVINSGGILRISEQELVNSLKEDRKEDTIDEMGLDLLITPLSLENFVNKYRLKHKDKLIQITEYQKYLAYNEALHHYGDCMNRTEWFVKETYEH